LVSGLVSLGLIVGLWNARLGIADDWESGFGWIFIFQGLLVIAFGAGAAVLWYATGQPGIARKILIGTVALLVVGTGCSSTLQQQGDKTRRLRGRPWVYRGVGAEAEPAEYTSGELCLVSGSVGALSVARGKCRG
jgi:vacuolar-type H+-ATPase subunit I/STV1